MIPSSVKFGIGLAIGLHVGKRLAFALDTLSVVAVGEVAARNDRVRDFLDTYHNLNA